MTKKILIIYYSQSGQLKEIADNFVKPFEQNQITVEWLEIIPVQPFSFPWSGKRFFDAMPESVLGIPAPLKNFELKSETYDLIVFAYSPWFLSPSIPATSALNHPQLIKVLKNTPVVTLIGSRNMWIMAQEKIKKLLAKAEANLVGNIVLEDKHPNLISAITIQYWMFTGKKDRFLNIFPEPGVSGSDIKNTHQFGEIVLQYLCRGNFENLQTELIAQNAVRVHPNLLFVESRGAMLFNIWANIIIKKKNRIVWLKIFKYYLVFALFILSPVVVLAYVLILRPFLISKNRRMLKYYSGVDLK